MLCALITGPLFYFELMPRTTMAHSMKKKMISHDLFFCVSLFWTLLSLLSGLASTSNQITTRGRRNVSIFIEGNGTLQPLLCLIPGRNQRKGEGLHLPPKDATITERKPTNPSIIFVTEGGL